MINITSAVKCTQDSNGKVLIVRKSRERKGIFILYIFYIYLYILFKKNTFKKVRGAGGKE